jgi:hypothetical protein
MPIGRRGSFLVAFLFSRASLRRRHGALFQLFAATSDDCCRGARHPGRDDKSRNIRRALPSIKVFTDGDRNERSLRRRNISRPSLLPPLDDHLTLCSDGDR